MNENAFAISQNTSLNSCYPLYYQTRCAGWGWADKGKGSLCGSVIGSLGEKNPFEMRRIIPKRSRPTQNQPAGVRYACVACPSARSFSWDKIRFRETRVFRFHIVRLYVVLCVSSILLRFSKFDWLKLKTLVCCVFNNVSF